MQTDPAWHDNLLFSEYFHGDNGAAIGAFHQTGWTGLVADLIRHRHGEVEALGDVIRRIAEQAGHELQGVTAQPSTTSPATARTGRSQPASTATWCLRRHGRARRQRRRGGLRLPR